MTVQHTEGPTAPAYPGRRFSILPAATVLIVAVVTLVIFTAINALDSTTTTATTLPDVVVLGAPPVASAAVNAALFEGFTAAGTPPSDVATALLAPAGTTKAGDVHTGGGGAGNYDQAVRLDAATTQAKLLGFYKGHLTSLGWRLFSTGAAHGGGAQVLFEKGGSDGWYWELGVVATGAGASTPYTYRLFQVTESS